MRERPSRLTPGWRIDPPHSYWRATGLGVHHHRTQLDHYVPDSSNVERGWMGVHHVPRKRIQM